MTKCDTIAAIKALGMTAKWDSEYQEFIVNFRVNDGRRTDSTDYHTPDSDDAIATAKVNSEWRMDLA